MYNILQHLVLPLYLKCGPLTSTVLCVFVEMKADPDMVFIAQMKKRRAPDTEGQCRAAFSLSSTVVSGVQKKLHNLGRSLIGTGFPLSPSNRRNNDLHPAKVQVHTATLKKLSGCRSLTSDF